MEMGAGLKEMCYAVRDRYAQVLDDPYPPVSATVSTVLRLVVFYAVAR